MLLFFVDPEALHDAVRFLTQHELSESPHDLIASTLVNVTQGLSPSAQTFGALYLLSHGVIKLTLVVALLRQRLWAYPVAILVSLPFLLYQVYRYTLTLAPMMLVLSVADLVVIALTLLEYQRQRRRRSAQEGEVHRASFPGA